MDFKRTQESLEAIFAFVDSFASNNGIEGDSSRSIKLVVEEIFTNFLRHNRGGKDYVSVSLEKRGGRVLIKLHDYEVESFRNPALAKTDTGSPLEEREVGGLGIHLVRCLSEQLSYSYRDRTLEVVAIMETGKRDV